MVVYIGIGNSDDKLSQKEWFDFMLDVLGACDTAGTLIGEWYSPPVSNYQNACFCVEVAKPAKRERFRKKLEELAAVYSQESISWAEAETEFLKCRRTTLPVRTARSRTTRVQSFICARKC